MKHTRTSPICLRNTKVFCEDKLWKNLFNCDACLIEEELLQLLGSRWDRAHKIELKATEDPYNYDIYVNGKLFNTDF